MILETTMQEINKDSQIDDGFLKFLPESLLQKGTFIFDMAKEAQKNDMIYNAKFTALKDSASFVFDRFIDSCCRGLSLNSSTDDPSEYQKNFYKILIGIQYSTSYDYAKKMAPFFEWAEHFKGVKEIEWQDDGAKNKAVRNDILKVIEKIEGFYKSFSKIAKLIQYLKKENKIQKGRVLKSGGQNVYRPPTSSSDQMKKVLSLVDELISDVRDTMIKNAENSYKEIVANYIRLATPPPDSKKMMPSPYAFFKSKSQGYERTIVAKFTKSADYLGNSFKIVDDYDTKVRKYAESNTDDILAQFRKKQISKLSSIVEKKGNLENGKRLYFGSGVVGTIDVDIRLFFKDGSAFTIKNQIIMKSNQHGTVFVQYPSTFHDVVFPDGTKKAKQSEQEMNEKFATAQKETIKESVENKN